MLLSYEMQEKSLPKWESSSLFMLFFVCWLFLIGLVRFAVDMAVAVDVCVVELKCVR